MINKLVRDYTNLKLIKKILYTKKLRKEQINKTQNIVKLLIKFI